jgi:LytS/YehU family sensor histidine kinase
MSKFMPYPIIDILSFNAALALLLTFVWYVVKNVNWSGKYWYYYTLGHLCCALLIWVACTCANNIFMLIVAAQSDGYYSIAQGISFYRFCGSIIMYLLVVMTFYLYKFVKVMQEKHLNEIRLTETIKINELNMLRSQINPHFLFNSLNSLNSLIISDSAQAQSMLLALSEYLRSVVLSNDKPFCRLDEEMRNIERYLFVEKIRFGARLHYTLDIPPSCGQAQVPSMLLQPLFENAVKHSVYENLQQIEIVASAALHGDTLEIVISNTCSESAMSSSKKGAGSGIRNVRERLWLTYGQQAGLHAKIKDGVYIAMLRLPLR